MTANTNEVVAGTKGAETTVESKQKEGSTSKDESKEEKEKPKAVSRYDEYWDLRSFTWKLRKSAKADQGSKKKTALFVVRRRIDHKGRHFATEIDIHSKIISDVLNEIHAKTQRTKLKQSPPIIDPQLLFHSLPELEERLQDENGKEEPSEDVVYHLQSIIDLAKKEHEQTLSGTAQLFQAGEITWDLLWALYKPNTIGFHFHELTEQQMLVLIRFTHKEKRQDGWYYVVGCDIVHDDGINFGFAKKDFDIKEYEGQHTIKDLPVFPLEYHEHKDDILLKAKNRGGKLVTLTGHTYHEISGSAMREIRTAEQKPREVRFFSSGKLIVDPKSFRLFVPDAEYNFAVYQSLDRTKLTDEQLSVCSPVVLGYCFGVKQWGGFGLDRCRDIVWQEDAFASLVLEPSRKALVQSLVRQHKKRKEAFDDVIAGKGRGLIGLLSGRPGSGKTLTAESISQTTRQPLYTVSAGELGDNPKDVDEKLTMILALAVTWDAIVLLDEADVFLQTRDDASITRNALVSIFLRQLEYYEGILVLTTNRIGNIDSAFESRIHFSFFYPDLNAQARRQVWQQFWTRAGVEGVKVQTLSEAELDALAKHNLNGRQIKNTVAGALSIALEEGAPLSMKHVETVLAAVESWDAAIARTEAA